MANKNDGKAFAATVKRWADARRKDLELVFQESAQRVIAEMQKVGPSVKNPGGAGGHMPVDKGFLRSSLRAALNSAQFPVQEAPEDVQAFTYNEGEVALIILAARLGDSIYAVYTAAYARRMEYGFNGTDSLGRSYNQEGYGFVRLAAQKWQKIVAEVVKEAKLRSKAQGGK